MTLDRIKQLRNLIYQVHDNDWKRRTGLRSQREEADASNMDMVGRLCDALEEALLTELEKKGQHNDY